MRELVQHPTGEVWDGLNFQLYQTALVEDMVVDDVGAPVPRASGCWHWDVVHDLTSIGTGPCVGVRDAA